MKAAIFNPYLDTLGGGERYTAGVIEVLIKKGYEVDIEWKDVEIVNKLEKRFGVKLGKMSVTSDIKRGKGYDLCFWVSDGSIPTLLSKNNILHFQFPFNNVKGKSVLNKIKITRVNYVVCNSKFTKNVIDKEYGIRSTVIYPPVSLENFKSKEKKNIILAVGRFSQLTQAKKQDILITTFIKMCDKGLENYRLCLVGGVEVGGKEYVAKLRKLVGGYPIDIIINPSFKELTRLYSVAKIFWSASGFGVDQIKDPKKVEHFGIVVVEAMAAGCIPVVYSAGGHKEIIEDRKSGLLWKTRSELEGITFKLINESKMEKMSSLAIDRSRKFSDNVFFESFENII